MKQNRNGVWGFFFLLELVGLWETFLLLLLTRLWWVGVEIAGEVSWEWMYKSYHFLVKDCNNELFFLEITCADHSFPTKGLVHHIMKILSIFTHLYVIHNLYDFFFFSVDHKTKYLKNISVFFDYTLKVSFSIVLYPTDYNCMDKTVETFIHDKWWQNCNFWVK